MPIRRQKLLGIWVDSVGMDDAVAYASALAQKREKSVVISGNLNFAELAAQDPRLQACNRESALTVADGMPIVVASQFTQQKLAERLPGSELLERFCEAGAAQGHTFFFVGRRKNATATAIRKLKKKYPGFSVVGMQNVSKPITAKQTKRVLEKIRASRPHYLILALGQPQGELWIHKHLREIEAGVIFQVGNALDLISGLMRRAPPRLGDWGLEWAFRLLQEPKRLGPRYLANGKFLATFALKSIPGLGKAKSASDT